MSSIHFDDILAGEDIFESCISPTDVLDFFHEHQKRLAKKVLRKEDSWFFQSNSCGIGCNPGEKGNLLRKYCIGCVLACRLTRNCVYPGFGTTNKIDVNGRMIYLQIKDISEKEAMVKRYVNNSILTYLLDEVDSGGAVLFCYECNGKIVLIGEMSKDFGLGFGGLIKEKDNFLHEIKDLICKIDLIDKILKENCYLLKSPNEKQLNVVCSKNRSLSLKIYTMETDGIDKNANPDNCSYIKKMIPSSLNRV